MRSSFLIALIRLFAALARASASLEVISPALVLSLVIATIAAGLSTSVTDKRDFKEIAVRTVMAEKASGPGSKCPLARESIDSADLNLLSICMAYGLVTYDAAQRYPASAPKIFALYGGEPTFQRILDRYGHQIIPIVAYFVDNGSSTHQFHQAAGNALRQIWQGNIPKWDADLSREQIGLMAIYEIDERGQGLLADFFFFVGSSIVAFVHS